jgi:hypothetical protein
MDMGVHCVNLQSILDGIVHTMAMGSILWTLIKNEGVHTMDMGVHCMNLQIYLTE